MTKEEILTQHGCPSIPFDENVTMYYPAILSAMDEYAEQEVETARKHWEPKWIPVSERLPEINQHVLVLRTSPNIVTTGYIHKYGHWIWSNLNGSTHKADHIYKITHWRPIPQWD